MGYGLSPLIRILFDHAYPHNQHPLTHCKLGQRGHSDEGSAVLYWFLGQDNRSDEQEVLGGDQEGEEE